MKQKAPAARGRLLVLAPSAFALGGVATWLDYLVPGLRSRGWGVGVALTSGRFHDREAYLRAHPIDGATSVAAPTGSVEGRRRALVGLLRRERPDLALGVNLPDLFTLGERAPESTLFVVALHGLLPELFDDVRRLRTAIDGAVATNRLACRLLEEMSGLERERIHYAPYGVELPEAAGEREEATALRIGYVGRLDDAQKRVRDLPRIVRELASRDLEFEFVVAGSGPDGSWLRAELEPWIAAGTVRWLDEVESSRLDEVYGALDILLVTSHWETGPIVAWEAMAHQVVLVAADYVGSGVEGSLLDGVNCRLYARGDAVSAAEVILSLRERRVRERLAEAGRSLVATRYTREVSIDAWDRALAACLAKGRRPGPRAPWPVGPAGRLDRLLGIGLAESVRERLRLRFPHREAGGEWPHRLGPLPDANFFWTVAEARDRAGGARE